jgi:predicted aspartyl protease
MKKIYDISFIFGENMLKIKSLKLISILGLAVAFFIMVAEGTCLEISEADSLFRQGFFNKAESIYQKILSLDTANAQAHLSLGRVALLGNRFKMAEDNLKILLTDSINGKEAAVLLAEAYYRQDRFSEAAPLFAQTGQKAKSDKLKSFIKRTPYFIEGNKSSAEIPFVQTDPLPLIMLTVNGSEAMFLIDTGGWELSIDEELAKELGLELLGSQTATFAGGKTAPTYHGILDSVKAGSFTIKNVPINISQGSSKAAQMFNQPIRGVVGTCFLYHFNFTFDYPGGKLILSKRGQNKSGKPAKDDGQPFWMAGDHIMVAWGRVNNNRQQLFFIDTGLAGGGFTATEATVKMAGIKLGETGEGMGGGGKVQVRPFTVDRLRLGETEEINIRGLFGALPPGFENRFGFTIGGIISHGFFRPYRLTFDFDQMKIFLEKTK